VPAAKTDWVIGPDGVDTRVVGRWVLRKVHHVDRFADIFATAMRTKWPHRGYVELFAGPGLSRIRGANEFVIGSARRALGRDFTNYVFVDLDRRATRALEARLAADAVTTTVDVLTGDCNLMVPNIRRLLPTDALTLVFVDPTAVQIEMTSLVQLANGRHMDLLVTFQVSALIRVGMSPSKAVDDFFGTPDWRSAVPGPRERLAERLVTYYNEQLTKRAGYLPGAFKNAVSVKNAKNRTIYELVLFSRHPLGNKFWAAAGEVDELGQGRLWDEVAL
jgi:three-Cys-motif partner protein